MKILRRLKSIIWNLIDQARGITISREYVELNRQLHDKLLTYGTSAAKWAPVVKVSCNVSNAISIVDYGCGKALLANALSGEFDVQNYDPAIARYSARPVPADLVVCSDVLEHIEPHLLQAVLKDLRSLGRQGMFAVVSTRPAKKILSDGRNAHLIQQPGSWWVEKLMAHFHDVYLVGISEKAGEAVVFCTTNADALSDGDLQQIRQSVEDVYKQPQEIAAH